MFSVFVSVFLRALTTLAFLSVCTSGSFYIVGARNKKKELFLSHESGENRPDGASGLAVNKDSSLSAHIPG